jgi:hypothetical protein
MQKKDLFIRNLTNKTLGYALGRGLTLQDSCTVDDIIAQVERSDYSAHALIDAVVMSTPFRYQSGMVTQSLNSTPKHKTETERKKL